MDCRPQGCRLEGEPCSQSSCRPCFDEIRRRLAPQVHLKSGEGNAIRGKMGRKEEAQQEGRGEQRSYSFGVSIKKRLGIPWSFDKRAKTGKAGPTWLAWSEIDFEMTGKSHDSSSMRGNCRRVGSWQWSDDSAVCVTPLVDHRQRDSIDF
jgi:hypothetical protein